MFSLKDILLLVGPLLLLLGLFLYVWMRNRSISQRVAHLEYRLHNFVPAKEQDEWEEDAHEEPEWKPASVSPQVSEWVAPYPQPTPSQPVSEPTPELFLEPVSDSHDGSLEPCCESEPECDEPVAEVCVEPEPVSDFYDKPDAEVCADLGPALVSHDKPDAEVCADLEPYDEPDLEVCAEPALSNESVLEVRRESDASENESMIENEYLTHLTNPKGNRKKRFKKRV